MSAPDVLVIGGGIIGCAVAADAAERGLRVTVLERGRTGEEASWAAAGMLSPLAEAVGPGPFLDLLLEARERFPALAPRLRDATGIDIGYRDEGAIVLALRPEDDDVLNARLDWQRGSGLAVERLDAREVLEREPAVTDAVRWGLLYPGDHQVDARRLSRAFRVLAERRGAVVREGEEVREISIRGGRAIGVLLADGAREEGATVVVAGGAWSGRLHGLPRPLPLRPVHGQLAAVEHLPPLFRHIVTAAGIYAVPRADGRMVLGATEEECGFRKAVTPAGLARVLQGAAAISPVLGEATLTGFWSGLRPTTPDRLPVLGADPEVNGLLYATGHHRNGILLAPITGELIGAMAAGEEPALDLGPYGAGRFGDDPEPYC